MSLYGYELRDNQLYLSKIVYNLEKSITAELNTIHGKKWCQKSWSYLINPWIRLFVIRTFCLWSKLKTFENKIYSEIELDIPFGFSDSADCMKESQISALMNFFIKQSKNSTITFPPLIFKYTNKEKSTLKATISTIPLILYLKIILLFKKNIFWDYFFKYWKLSFFSRSDFLFTRLNIFASILDDSKSLKKGKIFRDGKVLKSFKATNEFEEFLKWSCMSILPQVYLEKFQSLEKTTNFIFGNKRIRKVFVHTSIYGDEILKFWIAISRSKSKFPLIYLSSHIPGLELGPTSWYRDFESSFADFIIPWGKRATRTIDSIYTNVSSIPPRCSYAKKQWIHTHKNSTVLYIIHDFPKLPYWFHYNPIGLDLQQFGSHQKKIVGTIVSEFKHRNLVVQSYPINYGVSKNISDYAKKIGGKLAKKSLDHSINEASLVVLSTLSTVFYQCMYVNIPVIMVLDDFAWYNKEIKSDFEGLYKVGIIKQSSSVDLLNPKTSPDKIFEWWKSKKVQASRKKFLEDYCNDKSDKNNSFIKISDNYNNLAN